MLLEPQMGVGQVLTLKYRMPKQGCCKCCGEWGLPPPSRSQSLAGLPEQFGQLSMKRYLTPWYQTAQMDFGTAYVHFPRPRGCSATEWSISLLSLGTEQLGP